MNGIEDHQGEFFVADKSGPDVNRDQIPRLGVKFDLDLLVRRIPVYKSGGNRITGFADSCVAHLEHGFFHRLNSIHHWSVQMRIKPTLDKGIGSRTSAGRHKQTTGR